MNVTSIILLLALLVNPLTSIAKRDKFPQQVNAAIALVLSGLGALFVVLTGTGIHLSDPAQWAGIASTIYATSQIIYHGLFANSSLDKVLTALPGKVPPAYNDNTPLKK